MLDRLKFPGRDKNRTGGFPGHTLSCSPQKAGRKSLVDSSMTQHDKVRHLGTFTDLVGSDAHVKECVMPDAAFFTALAEIIKNGLASLFQYLPHPGGKIQIGFKTQGARDIVEKSPFYGNRVDDVLTKEGSVELFRHPKAIIQSRLGMLRTIEGNQDIFYHFSLLMFRAYERSSVPSSGQDVT